MTGGIFAVLDDIAVLMDDVAVMGKLAAKKTAGILGDDLAVNAEKATGFQAARELPVLWAITKGSFINKLIILPIAFLLSAYAPKLIVPILLLGGAYLSYEGMEKVYHLLTHTSHPTRSSEKVNDKNELLRIEKAKIRSAVHTDFILSIEIIIIALGTVMGQSLLLQVIVVSLIAILATVGVYGLVALLVRMDDTGYFLIKRAQEMRGKVQKLLTTIGTLLVASLPKIIRALGVVGTVAMLLVGGGMFSHTIHALDDTLGVLPVLTINLLFGMAIGSILLGLHHLVQRMGGHKPAV